MGHIPVFRWLLAVGLVLIGCSAGLYIAAPSRPELRQVELTVLDEKPDGACTVRWADPFEHREREASYLCDPERDPILKAPNHDTDSSFGWETGFVVAEGPDKGELYALEVAAGPTDWRIELSDHLVLIGLLLTIVGLVGGNFRALSRAYGVAPHVIRRAKLLREAAASVARDHERAVEAVRESWAPLHGELVDAELGRIPVARLQRMAHEGLQGAEELAKAGVRTIGDVLNAQVWGLVHSGVRRQTAERAVAAARRIADEVGETVGVRLDADRQESRTTALVVALWVLVEAGPQVQNAVAEGTRLAERLESLLADAAPASGLKHMMSAGREQRCCALAAVAELRLLLDEAERDGISQQFAQASVDLLRGPDSELFERGHRSGDGGEPEVRAATHKAPVPSGEVFEVSTHRHRSLVGSPSCRTRPPACPGRVGHHAHRHPRG
ncbi:hypothetical protein [Streptomyces sp. CC228A]|uniref:hypothetical protein n=1 Tax=Streptomyces sp. CC228A TaxID=2898186 RepID=UPI001F1F58B7|nr:hypothetical protein [Streptomyces sp. CC228A]